VKSDSSSEAFESDSSESKRRAQIITQVDDCNKLKKETLDTNTEKQEYTITVYTENQVGLLNRIAIIFSRRKINVESLNTSPSEIDGIHRFTIVIHESRSVVIKLVRQIEKQVEVLKTYFNTNDEIVWQELALYKVLSEEITERAKVERLLREFGARAIAIRKDFIVFETTGHREETNKLMKALEPFGLVEFVRSARVAIIKESSGFHEKLKDFENREPSEEVIENEYLGKREAVFTM
jgi:acetolactate synthase-1/3 small subunit